jgi:hypothetical protein
VGWEIDVDLTVLHDVLLKEPTIVLGRHVLVAHLDEGVPQQHREAVTVQTPRAQPAILKGVVRVVSHLRQEFGISEFLTKKSQMRELGHDKVNISVLS